MNGPIASLPIFQGLNIKNDFVDHFPLENPEPLNTAQARAPRQTPGVLGVRCLPTPVRAPKMLCWSPEVAGLLGFLEQFHAHPEECAQVFSGNKVTACMSPYASCYGGHQFGHWAGQLGDGRALNLMEVASPQGHSWCVQLKGAGPTPYSRRADGRAVLRSSLREFLCSEAMWHLGVPTTRALCCVTTGDDVYRDMFYDGNTAAEPGAIVTRVAPSFIRFGHFEILAARKETTLLRSLVNFVVSQYFPQCLLDGQVDVGEFFKQVCSLTADLMVHWQRVGFVHGVMNTDNMSILGLTIDYGPYGWTDVFDPNWTPNTTDLPGRRYAFAHQPRVALWNLSCLAQALVSLDTPGLSETLGRHLNSFQDEFSKKYNVMMMQKLGFESLEPLPLRCTELLNERLHLCGIIEVDPFVLNRILADWLLEPQAVRETSACMDAYFSQAFYVWPLPVSIRSQWEGWLMQFSAQVALMAPQPQQLLSYVKRIKSSQPYFVLRNYLVQQAIDQVNQGDIGLLNELMECLKSPYEESEKNRKFFGKRPEWARHKPGCATLSCSS